MDERVRAPKGKTAAIVAEMERRIGSGALAPGQRLPSVRAFAASAGVSKATVVEAYDRLAAAGLVTARRGSGFYVGEPVATAFSLAHTGARVDRAIDPFWVSRQALEADDEMLKPGCGWLPPSWMPEATLRAALRALARRPVATLTEYAPPMGSPELRRLIARRLAARGVDCGPARILLTDSATHALDLVCRLILSPGDCVLVDDPGYFNFLAMLRAHRAEVVGVPRLANGPDLEALERLIAARRPKLWVTASALHNPTGGTLAASTAHRALALAEARDLTIVEDDVFADFESEPSPRLAALDGLNRVALIGGFSKTLTAAARCGYVCAREEWLEGLAALKIATSFGSDRLGAELALTAAISRGERTRLEALRSRLARARELTIRRLENLGVRPWLVPRAGLFLWCELPDGLNAAEVARRALGEGLLLAPGDVFSPSLSASAFMRFNASQCENPSVFERLASAMRAACARGASSVAERPLRG